MFETLYRDYANSAGMPETRTLLAELGVLGSGEDVRLTNDAPLAATRRALMVDTRAAALDGG